MQKRDAHGVIRHGAEWLALWSDPDSMRTEAEKALEKNALQQRTRLEISLSATARSLATDPELVVGFDPAAETGEIAVLRGRTDSIAFRRRFHDRVLHARLAPENAADRELFDLCEKVRCEACGVELFPGARENLAAEQHARLEHSGLLNAHLAVLVPVAEGLNMVLRDVLTGAAEPSITSQGLWMWDRWLREHFSTALQELKRAFHDQEKFAIVATSFVRELRAHLGVSADLRHAPSGSTGPEQDEPAAPSQPARENPAGSVQRPGMDSVAVLPDPAWLEVRKADVEPPYRVFTTAHDAIVRISEIVNAPRLRELRQTLEHKRASLHRELARLAARFQRRLLARLHRDWEFDLDEGLLDASRLDRVVVNPGFASAYKQERESSFPDTVVSILIDNSGSMRGKPIEISCLAADLIATALERCGLASEILGFTTREWKGGRSAADWARAGKPADPGRVNDLLHVVYKSATEPMRRARLTLAGMLDPNLLKENIDGEGLAWAARRLLARPERRKILIVVSDGAPVDQFTLEVNSDKRILDRHLREVIANIERGGMIEVAALGVKHHVGSYYRKSLEIADLENLGAGLIGMVDTLLCTRPGF